MKPTLSMLCLILVLGTNSSVYGEETDTSPENETEQTPTPEVTLDSIVVIGEAPEAELPPVAGSVDVIGRQELEIEHVDDTYELFDRVPGVYLARYNQGIINTDVAIRGFAGDGVTPHAKLLIDGVPANLHNGYGELDQLFPTGLSSISSIKGTSDAAVGLHAVAGAYLVETRADTGVREIELAAGSYDAREAQGYFGFANDRLVHGYSLGYREAKGYRDHTDVQKHSLAGRWAFALSDRWSLTAIGRTSGYEGDAPGYLSREDARRDPRSSASFASQDGGDKKVHHGSVHLDGMLSSDLNWTVRTYGQFFERERWVRFSQAGSLQNRFDDQEQFGGRSTLRWAVTEAVTLDWGIDFEDQDVIEQRFGTVGQTRVRDPQRVIRDRRYDFSTVGTYLRAEVAQSERFSWNLGLRADRLSGDFLQFAADGSSSPRDIYDFGTIFQPKLNVFFAPTQEWTLFLNAGRTFQHPFGASAFTAGDRSARDVSRNDGWETGARWNSGRGLELRASVWGQRASDEFVVIDGDGRNVGETDRQGIDLGANLRLGRRYYLWANYSRISTEIVRGSDADRGFVGNDLRGIPSFTASAGFNAQVSNDLRFGLHMDAQGDAFVNEANLGGQLGGFTLAHATVHYETPWGVVGLEINNLFDEFYEYVFDFGQTGEGTIHSPGDGRNATLSFRFKI